jgi:hypothetical protein
MNPEMVDFLTALVAADARLIVVGADVTRKRPTE